MNKKNILLTGLVALALTGLSAHAQTIAGIADLNSVTDGDLVLGARNSSSPNDLVIDLGQYTQFQGLTPGVTYTLTDVKAADFISTFGSSVFSTAGTTWTVFGGVGSSGVDVGTVNQTLWGSSVWTGSTHGTLASASASAQQGTSVKLDTYTNSLLGGTSLTGNGAQSVPASSGFTQLIGQTGNFGYSSFTNIEGSTVGTSKLELFKLSPLPSASLDLGTLTLSSSGLTFTAFAAIPEPSTYAAILGAATLGFVAIRRRKQNQLVA